MSRFCKFGKLHVTKGNVDKIFSRKAGLRKTQYPVAVRFLQKKICASWRDEGDSPRQESGTSPAQERTLQIVLPRIGGIASS